MALSLFPAPSTGGGGGATNLSRTLAATQVTITSDTGDDAIIPAADTTNAGVMTKLMYDKLAGVEAAAEVTSTAKVSSAGAVMKSLFDANTILIATADNDPAPLTVGASTFVGRKASGDIVALTTAEAKDLVKKVEALVFVCSDETTDLAVTAPVVTYRMPYGYTVTGVTACVTTAPVGATLTVDIKQSGTSILSTLIGIPESNEVSTSGAVSNTALVSTAKITIEITQVGVATKGAGLKVTILGHRA